MSKVDESLRILQILVESAGGSISSKILRNCSKADSRFLLDFRKGAWKTYSYDKDKGLEIFTNTDFPAYSATKDKVFYAVLHIAEGISEFFVQAAQEEFANVDEVKQIILRKAAMLKTEITV